MSFETAPIPPPLLMGTPRQRPLLCLLGSGLLAIFPGAHAVAHTQLRAKHHHQHQHSFVAFIEKHGRQYEHGSKEYEERLDLFSKRASEVARLNSRPGRLWTAGVNALSDRTEEELAQLRGWHGGAAPSGAGSRGGGLSLLGQRGRTFTAPAEFLNWTALASVAHSTDQLACGSCWAIASATVLEAHSEIYIKDKEQTFSVQQLVNCVSNPHECGGAGGCEGATVELAFDWVMRNGLAEANAVPYTGNTGSCGRAAPATPGSSLLEVAARGAAGGVDGVAVPGVHRAQEGMAGWAIGLRGWERLPENRYEPLLHAIVERGPVAVSVSASAWAPYEGGIFDGCERDAVIEHAVPLIGFGLDQTAGRKYWLILNSWGDSWGEEGKIRLLRRDDDDHQYCGTDRQPELGTGCKGGPKQVRVCGMCGILYDSAVPHFQ